MDNLDDEYECFTCKRRFRCHVFSISKEWDRVDYSGKMPSVEVTGSYGLECYCSSNCCAARRHIVMNKEGVPVRYPNIGPIELCAKCGSPVNMADYHLTYVESYDEEESSFVLRTIDLVYLAVLCLECRPLALEEMDSTSTGKDETYAFDVETS
ncbi:hypothetical protein [Paraburkholderia bannensis]|uniref:hypothetical protein n=1 Tax=Paraburkholderia bannensis TaxID=765414 RepID=UPI002AB623A1|nr:hypothetical protein [Paraburkholderia bannensis]